MTIVDEKYLIFRRLCHIKVNLVLCQVLQVVLEHLILSYLCLALKCDSRDLVDQILADFLASLSIDSLIIDL